ncbi:MAG: hypothetical protein ACQGVC_24125 [Myxococcota bacterium]
MSRFAVVLLLGVATLASGCLTRHVREDVFKQDRVQVFLRQDERLFRDVVKGYDHPATISAVRIAHILSRIDMRLQVKEGNRRKPAIPTELLYQIADGMSQSLARAGENQEVVVMALRSERNLAVLSSEYLTSLIAYVRADKLYIHLSHSDDLMKDSYRKGEKLPAPRLSDSPSRFRLYGGTAMTLISSNAVAVAWRDKVFSRPTRTKILPTGEVKRKTILLESPDVVEEEEALEGPSRAKVPDGLSPGQLRALADLEEERLSGAITETEYRMRQQEILESE